MQIHAAILARSIHRLVKLVQPPCENWIPHYGSDVCGEEGREHRGGEV